jgi:phosphoadenosine phosphosulfate reductase
LINKIALIDRTLSALDFSLSGREDYFVTTSFGYQSALLFFLIAELGISPKCLFVKSNLASGGIDKQMDYIAGKYDIDLHIVDRSWWLQNELEGSDFLSLDDKKRKSICRNLKREPLLDFIATSSSKIWISGIRKDQTDSRQAIDFMEVTDLDVIKLSPLYAWSKVEAKELILSNNLKINSEYIDLCKLNDSKECGLHY